MFGKRYFNVHRIMFMILGLWPHQRPNILRLQAVFFSSVYFTTIIFQLTTFATTMCDIDCLVKRVSYICITIVYILNYYSFYFNASAVKESFEHMQLDWKLLENNNAMKILEEYVYDAYLLMVLILIASISGMFFFFMCECTPMLLDVFLPLNESRLRKTEVSFELFIDEQQYFLVHVIYEILGLIAGFTTVIMTGTYLLFIAKHVCAIYRIASNIMQGTVTEYVLQSPVSQRTYFMYNSIRHSVHIHRRNMKLVFFIQLIGFINDMLFAFQLWYFPLVILCVLSLSCILLRLSIALGRINNYFECFVSFVIFYIHLLYMIMANVCAQSIIDHSAEMLNATYSTLWYLAPVRIQKLFLFMHSSVKDHKIKVAGFFVPSIEGFSTLVTTAVSYFTVMHAMHS